MSAPGQPRAIRRGFPLARLTTIRTGGPAEYFARAGSEAELLELLAWAQKAGAHVSVVGSGSNLLVADEGVAGLVLKLDRDLASISVAEARLACGGGARLPAVAARAARAGLSGIEFGVNIPGTLGGAVRMNANAYGGELERALDWVEIATAGGVERRSAGELGLGYRSSGLSDGEIVAGASLLLEPMDPAAVKGALAQMRERRHEPSRRAFAPSARSSRIQPTPMRKAARQACCSHRPAATGSAWVGPASPQSTPTSSRTSVRPRPPT